MCILNTNMTIKKAHIIPHTNVKHTRISSVEFEIVIFFCIIKF